MQVHVEPSDLTPDDFPVGVPFPGAYTDTTPGIHFNIYTQNASTYVPPPPDVWADSEGGSIAQIGVAVLERRSDEIMGSGKMFK